MWASSGTAAANACGSPATSAPASVDSTAPTMNCAVIGGGERSPPLAPPAVDRPREALADLGAPAQGGAAGHVDLDQQAAGQERVAARRSGRAPRARPAARGASRSRRLGGVENPPGEPPDPGVVGRRVALGFAGEMAVELDPVAAVAVDHVLDGDPPEALLPADLEHRLEDAVVDLLGLPLAALVESGPVRLEACPIDPVHAARPPYLEKR